MPLITPFKLLIIVGLIVIQAFLGHLLAAASLFGRDFYSEIVIHIIFSVILLFVGYAWLGARRRQGEMWGQTEPVMITTSTTHKSETRLNAVFESAFNAIIMTKEDGEITDWNSQAERIFGWQPGEVISKENINIIFPSKQDFKVILKSQNAGDTLNPLEIQAVRKNRDRFPMRLSITQVCICDEVIYVIFIEDISEVKMKEKELVEAHQQALLTTKIKSEFLTNIFAKDQCVIECYNDADKSNSRRV